MRRTKYPDETIHLICKTLVDNNLNVTKTTERLSHAIPDLMDSYVMSVKRKNCRPDISDQYFSIDDIQTREDYKKYTDDQIHLMCQMLIETNYDYNKIIKYFKEELCIHVRYQYIVALRNGSARKSIGDQYFKSKPGKKRKFDDETIDMMCRCILVFNYDYYMIQKFLKEKKHIDVNYQYLTALRNDNSTNKVALKYFNLQNYRNKYAQHLYTKGTLCKLCNILVETNGDETKTQELMKKRHHTVIAKTYIRMLINKETKTSVTDQFFTKDQFNK